MYNQYLQTLDIYLPGTQSDNLKSLVPDDIREDVKEAERASYSQRYKACVTMCRRVIQLGLIDRWIVFAGLILTTCIGFAFNFMALRLFALVQELGESITRSGIDPNIITTITGGKPILVDS